MDGDVLSIANPSGDHPQYHADYSLFISCHYEADVHVLGDSDEFLMMELRERDVAHGAPAARSR